MVKALGLHDIIMKKIIYLFFIVFLALGVNAQKKKVRVTDETYEKLPRYLLNEINRFRKEKGLDTLEANSLLTDASAVCLEDYENGGQPKVDPKKTKKHLKEVGATNKGEELIMMAPLSKGRENYSMEDVAKVIYTRWENNKKDLAVVLNPKYVYMGMSYLVTEDSKKIYVAATLGGYDIENKGAENKGELEVPYNTKSKKLKAPDLKGCKNCDKWKKFDDLQKGLYVQDGKIYLKYGSIKELKRLLKKPKDGIAVDVVQRAQYENADYNIVDNNLYNKGVMTKVVYKDKFFKKNRIKPDPKAKKKTRITKIEVEMGKVNPKIKGPYELNLIIVQDGKVCRTVTRSYLEDGDPESNTPIGILPANDSKGLKPPFVPRSESSIINFTIPFEKNKFEFKTEDIQPLINALNEPDFIIEGLYIYAYSSIEGDSVSNAKLQRKRAESVTGVLQSRQQLKITPSIETRDSWNLFMLENEDGKYADLVNLGKKKCIEKINGDKKLMDELEPILARERFAQVIMDVTYDVSGNKEQKYSMVTFNRAVKANDANKGYRIMEYVGQQVKNKKYSAGALDSLEIPNDPKFVNMMNNKIHYRFLINNNTVDEDDYEELKRLLAIDPNNDVLKYNNLYCSIKMDSAFVKQEDQEKMQQKIDELYKSKIEKKYLDGLNIEWQFKLMDILDTTETPIAEAAREACINRIKSFYDMKSASWQNALKLAYAFSRAKDFKYAATILEPYVNERADENLILAYISIASHLPEKFYSRNFANALGYYKARNPERYCKLFGDPYMSFQVLDNPDIKKEYRSAGCKN